LVGKKYSAFDKEDFSIPYSYLVGDPKSIDKNPSWQLIFFGCPYSSLVTDALMRLP